MRLLPKPHESARHLAAILFSFGAIASLGLVWAPDFLPMVDAANHLARLHILVAPATSPLRGMYRVVWRPIPDLGLDLAYGALHGLISPETTLRLCVSLAFMTILGAVAVIQRALFGRLTYAAALTPLFLFGLPWHMGYINFLMSLSLALAGVAAYIAAGRKLTPLLIPILGVLGAMMCLCHIAGFAGFILLLGGLHLSDATSVRRWSQLVALIRKGLPLALVFAPGVALYLWCEKPAFAGGMAYGSAKIRILFAAVLATGGMRDLEVLIFLLVMFIVAWREKFISLWPGGKPVLWLFALVILLVPNRIGHAVDVDARLDSLFFLMLLAISNFRLPSGNGVARLLLGMLCALLIVQMARVAVQENAYSRTVAQFRARAAMIVPGSKLLVGIDDAASATCAGTDQNFVSPELLRHLGSFATIDRSAFMPLIFAGRGMQPIRLAHDFAALAPADPLMLAALSRSWLIQAANPADIPTLRQTLKRLQWTDYFLNWPQKFDYLLMLDSACATNPWPGLLRRIGNGDGFTLYQIIRPRPILR